MKEKKKILNVYQVHDEDENCLYFFVAHSPGQARYAFCQEIGFMFEESFGMINISVVPRMKKYIKGESSGYLVELFSDEHWVKALYMEGGSFTNSVCPDERTLSANDMLSRTCVHESGKDCGEWDDEGVWINLPKKVTTKA